MEPWKEALRKRAGELGFVQCGFTTTEPPARYPDFVNWIAAGRQAGMQYLATERSLSMRAAPARLLPSARSIISLAMPYPPPSNVESPAGEGRVAAYAQGVDYHEIVPERLRMLGRTIDLLAGRRLQHRVYVDTGPILEREIASRAGLGWIGRNSMLIHPAIGSFFFLAFLLTELELPPDPPFAFDRCGTCDRCLKACPTGCILPDRTIDSGRCISYWTIEHRGPIPSDVRARIGRWVFGCDICQMVCPWNRKSRPEAEFPFGQDLIFPSGAWRKKPLFPRRNGRLNSIKARCAGRDRGATLEI